MKKLVINVVWTVILIMTAFVTAALNSLFILLYPWTFIGNIIEYADNATETLRNMEWIKEASNTAVCECGSLFAYGPVWDTLKMIKILWTT